MNIIICDDNPLICDEIHSLVSDFFTNYNYTSPVFHIYNDGQALLSSDIKPDIVFLDIQMPELNGITVGNALHSKYPDTIIIVITSFIDYLDDAMRFKVFRYITKPIDKTRLFRNMHDALEQYNNHCTTISVKCGSDYRTINIPNIIMVEASLKQTIIYTCNGDYKTTMSFTDVKALLDYDYFYQCHRSFIINLKYVTTHNPRNIYLVNNLCADVAAKKYAAFKENYINYITSHF
mgnify:FL=1